MISALITGDLISDPFDRTTREGKLFVTVTARVAAGAEAIFVGIAAFEPTPAARLAQMRKGGSIAAVGVLERTSWTGKDGTERQGWRLTASEILTAYGATKKRRQAEERGDE